MSFSSSESDSVEAFRLISGVAIAVVAASLSVRRARSRRHGGSRIGKAPNRDRKRAQAAASLDNDYFARSGGLPVFTDKEFERRFRVPKDIYEKLRDTVLKEDRYFEQRQDAAGVLGATTDQKITAALRQLTGMAAESVVEYVRLSESTASKCMKRFCQAVVSGLKHEYLRLPTTEELVRIEAEYAALGFPGAIGCVDCASWEWDACPVAWQGGHIGKGKKACNRMEVVCDDYLYIWHFMFGSPGAFFAPGDPNMKCQQG